MTRRSAAKPGLSFAALAKEDEGGLEHLKKRVCHRKSEGIALIITLILLAVTLVMAIAFLAISNRERGSVSNYTSTSAAQFAADAALAHAEAQIVANMLATTNPYTFSLLVSTNYINNRGFNSGSADPTNVNYDYYVNGASPLSQQDFDQNVANLFYDPRPPVNMAQNYGSNSFYLDLNRNGRYDTNGWVTNLYVSTLDKSIQGLGSMSFQVGDPEWIGVLEHPDQPHGPNNPFIARYCFIAVPANSLDLNYIHNQALDVNNASIVNGTTPVNLAGVDDEYSRNQGVGTWELNLAAFLADLNTNRWDPPTYWNSSQEPYRYPAGAYGNSIAFDDARALIAWRYNNYYPLQASADSLFNLSLNVNNNVFINNGIDGYGVGSQTNFDANYTAFYLANNFPKLPWSGSENTNNFFGLPSDLFNTNKASFGSLGYSQFATNLYTAGTYNSTYDRYTFYRMLGQLGTDTLPASGKINLNYQNAVLAYDPVYTNFATSITIVPNMETNFASWQPRDFFTAAANQLLHAYTAAWFEESPSNYLQTYYGFYDTNYLNLDGIGVTNIQGYGQTNQIPSFGITNIPVFVNGQFVYTPAVNRLLQLAANIYDASTNTMNATLGISNYPSVFRPVFWITNELNPFGTARQTDVYIKGYEYVQEPLTPSSPQIFFPPIEVNDPSMMNLGLTPGSGGISYSNVWGVPWIVGAKKGLPNFNGLEVDNMFFIERLLQFNRTFTTSFPTDPGWLAIANARQYSTNQMYIVGISNLFSIEDWNSYASTYQNPVSIVAQYNLGFTLSNDAPGFVQINNPYQTNTGLTYQPWPGASYSGSFILPLGTNLVNQSLSPLGAPPCVTNTYVYFYGSPNNSASLAGFTYNAPCFIPTSANPDNYMDHGTPQLPHLIMDTTNRLWAYMEDTKNPNAAYILDYVQLGGMNSSLDVNSAIADPTPGAQGISGDYAGGLWSTNTYNGGGDSPLGINVQYLVSAGQQAVPTPPDGDGGVWANTPVPGAGTDTSPAAQAAFFHAFFTYDNEAVYNGETLLNTNYSIQAPFTPMRLVVQRFVYQANDPLVHYMTQDLDDFQDNTNGYYTMSLPPPTIQYLGKTSDRYLPWGSTKTLPGNFVNNGVPVPTDQNAYNLSYKDPLVWSSDNWDFPSYKYPSVGWLGRVHRGTPWQSVFLKSTNIMSLMQTLNGNGNIGLATWQFFTGDVFNQYDAYNTAPVWDRLLFDLFTATPDDDATRGQLNVNIGANGTTNVPDVMAGLASWSALFSGTLAFSNNFGDDTQIKYKSPHQDPISGQYGPYYTNLTIQPLGSPFYPPYHYSGNPTNAPLYQIVQGINNTRANFVNIDGLPGVFEHVGDILSTPQLSDASPFLNSADPVQQQYGISDEMYEWMPQNLLGLLTVSGAPQTPQRYVVYCYGQTLKPAPNGIVSSGSFFGLCTNYQVTAESASRAVIRVENAPTPANPFATPRVVIEQYNPLPPD